MKLDYPPKGIQLKDAPKYLGIDKSYFYRDFRPHLTEKRVGRRVVFDRLELDRLFDDIKPARRAIPKENVWGSSQMDSPGDTGQTGPSMKTSTSTRRTGANTYEKARERLIRMKQKGGSEKRKRRSTTPRFTDDGRSESSTMRRQST